jgi:hypothetical protein
MSKILRPTKKDISGHQLPPMAMLVALLSKHMPDGVDEEHLSDLVHEAITVCGSVKKAIRAIESGRLRADRIS